MGVPGALASRGRRKSSGTWRRASPARRMSFSTPPKPPARRDMRLLAAQLGSSPELLEQCARILATEGDHPRVDLNAGSGVRRAPASGSSAHAARPRLPLRERRRGGARRARHGVRGRHPSCARGTTSRGLLRENSARRAGGRAGNVTLHPRTRREGSTPGARAGRGCCRGGSAGRARGRQRWYMTQPFWAFELVRVANARA